MRTNTTTDFEVATNFTGHKIDMSLDQSQLAKLMGMFIDLYTDKIKAVLREYSTNAFDSHIEAGVDRPIELELPTIWSPFLKIRDYGIGMSEVDIVDIYSKYGATTKDQSDDYTGCLGLGCKSALTYTNQFILTGTKYGVKTTVAISREDTGGGSMVIVNQTDTDEPTGVEVQIPVDPDDIDRVKTKAAEFFRFWKPGTVLIDGVQPESIEGFEIEEGLLVIKDTQDYVVMGNVAYPTDLNVGLRRGYSLVAYVDMGMVTFPPNRESLAEDEEITRESKRLIREHFMTRVHRVVQDQIDDCSGPGAAVRIIMEWEKVLDGHYHSKKFTYGTETIPEFIQGRYCVSTRDSYRPSSHNWFNQIGVNYVADALFIKNYEPLNFTAGHKKKIMMYCDQHSHTQNTYVLSAGAFDDKWLQGATIVDWNDIKILKIPVNRTYVARDGGPKGSYKGAYVNGKYVSHLLAADIDTNKPIFWTNDESDLRMFNDTIAKHKPSGYTFVYLTNNRIAKFRRDFPKAKQPDEFLRKICVRVAKKVTRKDMLTEAVRTNSGGILKRLDANQVDDPYLKQTIELMSVPKSATMVAWEEVRVIARYCGADNEINLPDVEWENPLEAYELLDCVGSYYLSRMPTDHVYAYINGYYNQITKGDN